MSQGAFEFPSFPTADGLIVPGLTPTSENAKILLQFTLLHRIGAALFPKMDFWESDNCQKTPVSISSSGKDALWSPNIFVQSAHKLLLTSTRIKSQTRRSSVRKTVVCAFRWGNRVPYSLHVPLVDILSCGFAALVLRIRLFVLRSFLPSKKDIRPNSTPDIHLYLYPAILFSFVRQS